jgi:hypothetical protein
MGKPLIPAARRKSSSPVFITSARGRKRGKRGGLARAAYGEPKTALYHQPLLM